MSVKYKPDDAQAQNHVSLIPFQPGSWRMETNEFLADGAITNLFLLALKDIQDKPIETLDKEDWWTFYSLAGTYPILLLPQTTCERS